MWTRGFESCRLPVAAVLLVVLLVGTGSAFAQRVFAVTETTSASGEPVGVQLQSLEFAVPQILPGFIRVPGMRCSGPFLRSNDGLLAVSSEAVTFCSASPFKPVSMIPRAELGTVRARAACMAVDPRSSEALVVTLDVPRELSGNGNGAMTVFRHGRRNVPHSDASLASMWTLPGLPVAAVTFAGTRVAVLCRNAAGTGAVIAAGDLLAEGRPLTEVVIEAGEETSGLTASGLALSGDGQWLFAAASGYRLSGSVAEPVSRIYAVPVRDLHAVKCFSDLRGGLATSESALCTAGADACWAITTTPGTEFAYATRVRLAADGTITKEKEFALAPGPDVPSMAVRPGSEDLAVALGRRLEIWREGDRAAVSGEYADKLGAVLWSGEGLFVAEANRVHEVNPDTAQPLATLRLETGRVVRLASVPENALPEDDLDADGLPASAEIRAGTLPDNPDSDSDGIPDGVDPEPDTPSPQLSLPFRITFHGKAAGREIRALTVRSGPGGAPRWRVEIDSERMDWLVVTPRTGRADEPCYLAVNPARFKRGQPVSGVLTFHLEGSKAGMAAYGGPADVVVDVLPAPEGPKRALWLVDARAAALSEFADHLGAPPFFYSIVTPEAPFLDSLEGHDLVVLDMATATRGVVTRQALLDYVAQGGGLLLVGQHLAEADSRNLSHLLAPLGISIDPSILVEAVPSKQVVLNTSVDTAPGHLASHWPNPEITEGCAVTAAAPFALAVDETQPQHALAVARTYGYGRILVLAAAVPLQPPVVNGVGRRFAESAVAWLARAGVDIADMDGDGLPDAIEDVNDNGAWDTGETDYLGTDTDGDGIPDGVEDQNRNGTPDDGETDPRNADSDNDGTNDGADPSPCPAISAPYVIAVEGVRGAAEGPAEGGTSVIVTGRNFTQDCGVWFGKRRATARVQSGEVAVAVSPGTSRDEGETVAVRVLPAGELPGDPAGQAATPSSFRYTPKSRVRLMLELREPPPDDTPAASGEILVLFEAPEEVRARQVLLMLRVEPRGALEIEDLTETQQAGPTVPYLLANKTGSGDFLLHTPQGLAPFSSCLLGRVAWRLNEGANPAELRVTCSGAAVMGVTGALLDVSCPAAVSFAPGGVTAPTRAQDHNADG